MTSGEKPSQPGSGWKPRPPNAYGGGGPKKSSAPAQPPKTPSPARSARPSAPPLKRSAQPLAPLPPKGEGLDQGDDDFEIESEAPLRPEPRDPFSAVHDESLEALV